MPDLASLISLLQLAMKDRTQLALENIALRHQLAVYKRSVTNPRGGIEFFSVRPIPNAFVGESGNRDAS